MLIDILSPIRVLALAFIVMGFGCSKQSDSSSTRACIPGEQRSCACRSQGSGVQICNEQGSALGVCTGCLAPSTDGGSSVAAGGGGSNAGSGQGGTVTGGSAGVGGGSGGLNSIAGNSGVGGTTAPLTETYACPTGMTRVHVRDVWSAQANPTLYGSTIGSTKLAMATRPYVVILYDTGNAFTGHAARRESSDCDWYSGCINLTGMTQLAVSAEATPCDRDGAPISGVFDLSHFASLSDVWLDYDLQSNSIVQDYGVVLATPMVVGSGHFRVTATKSDVENELCAPGIPDSTVPDSYSKIHIRWLWGDPAKSGFAGNACELYSFGMTTPPYPTALHVNYSGDAYCAPPCGGGWALLELQNGDCPWYSLLVPSDFNSCHMANVMVTYLGHNTLADNVAVHPSTKGPYWISYNGASMLTTSPPCDANKTRLLSQVDTTNPGPAYAGCGH